VKQWFLNPHKFCRDITAEQAKYLGQCIYHLSASHPTETCHIKIDCDKRVQSKKMGSSPGNQPTTAVTGQLRHLTEEVFEDVDCDPKDDVKVSSNTNDDNLLYFVCVSKHYLRLAKTTILKTSLSRHPMLFPVIAGSGANFHMFKEKEFFESLVPAKGSVILGDGTTRLPIQGVGTVVCHVGEHLLRIENVRFVPSLSESIYSLLVHINNLDMVLNLHLRGVCFCSFQH